MDHLLESIKLHEGYRDRAYKDSVGVWTIGYGTNLQTLQIDRPLAETWLQRKIAEAAEEVARWPWTEGLNAARRDCIIEMVYNLGPEFGDGDRFRDWPMFVKQVSEGRYDEAAANMRSTLWARQVGRRADRLALQMRTGEYWNKE